MRKKYLIPILIVVILALIAGGFYRYNQLTYIRIGETTFRRDMTELTLTGETLPDTALLQQLQNLEQLDLRGMEVSIADYEQLKTALPHCRILWNVPFQGGYVREDTQELTVTALSPKDFESFSYLPALSRIDATACMDYDALLELKQAYPALDVRYNITIQGIDYPEDTASLTLQDADLRQLQTALPYLPELKEVTFTGITPDNELIYQLMCDYPQIACYWNLTVFGMDTPNTAEELILSGIPMENTREIESYLKYFPHLKRVEMCDCGIDSQQMDALSKRWPDIRFIWTIQVGIGTIRTDAVGFIPWKFGYDASRPLYNKDCKELKYCVDMVCLDLGHMRISDLSFLKYMPKLKYLIVGELPCPDFSPITYCKELIYLEIFNTTFTHQEILLELPKLQDLNMGSTKVYGTEVLKQMTWLKRLWLAGTGLSFAEYDELVAALPDTQVVMHIPHSTAGGWRDHQNYRDMRDLLGMFYME